MHGLSVRNLWLSFALHALAACVQADHKSDRNEYKKEGWANCNKVKGQALLLWWALRWCGSCQENRRVVVIGVSCRGHKHREKSNKNTNSHFKDVGKWTNTFRHSKFILHMHNTKTKGREREPHQWILLKSSLRSLSKILGDSYWFFWVESS